MTTAWLTWKFPWQPGNLTATGSNKGIEFVRDELKTAGKPSKVMLTAERNTLTPAWDDVLFVTAAVTDQNGIPVPHASDRVSFNIAGPGIIAAVDNGDNTDTDSFHASARRVYNGRCCAIIRATAESGTITLTVSATGLKGDSVSVEAVSGKPGPQRRNRLR